MRYRGDKAIAIVMPTHGRAGKVMTYEHFGQRDILTCVAESQERLYREHYPDAQFLVHPDSVKGIGPKRQWIYDTVGDVFMVDDDMVAYRFVFGPGGKTVRISGDRLIAAIENLYRMAQGVGAKLFGFSPTVNPIYSDPMNPIDLDRDVCGSAMGLIREGSRLRFNPSIVGVDDVYISMLNMHEHRFSLVDRRYQYQSKAMFTNEGGNAGNRTKESLERDGKILAEHFGQERVKVYDVQGQVRLDFKFRLTV